MKLFLILSKTNLDLSLNEVIFLLGLKKQQYKHYDNLLIIDIKPSQFALVKRLANSLKVYEFLFKTKDNSKESLKSEIKKFNWNKVYKTDFCLRIHSMSKLEPEYGAIIFDMLKNPRTRLRHASSQFEVYPFENTLICGKLIHENKDQFDFRTPDRHPGFSPISLHPRLAKTLVNMTGVKKGETFYDPLCGIGGLLMESSLMGIKSVGTDISWYMIDKSRKNIKHYNLSKITLKMEDSLKQKTKMKYVASDLPYGKNTKNLDTKAFYESFLKHLDKHLTKRAVLIFPHFADYRSIIKQTDLKIVGEYSIYVHASLTRKVVVLEK